MKKQFFYAAMAVALMASCTSEDNLAVDPVNPTPEEDAVALNLSVATPAMTVGSRGTGMVGFVGTEADKATNASWDSQRLFITMVDQTTNEEYEEPDGTKYFDGLEFRAPISAVNNSGEGNNIRFYQENTYGVTEGNEDKGTLEYKYYPVTGEYTFYGWHIDDATANAVTDGTGITAEFGKNESGEKQAKVSGIVINGTQDILAANTEVIPPTKPTATSDPYYAAANAEGMDNDTYDTMVKKQFSARTARNKFTPILNFEHVLSRLQFFVKAGKGTDAALNYMVAGTDEEGNTTSIAKERTAYGIKNDAADVTDGYDNWVGTDDEFTKYSAAGMLNGAIYVTGVKVLGVYDKIELDLINQTATQTGEINTDGFTLMSTSAQYNTANNLTEESDGYKTAKELTGLVAVAPSYTTDYQTLPDNYEADQVGESIMFLPVAAEDGATGTDKQIKIQVQLGQCLFKTEDETKEDSDPTKYTYYWDTPKPVTLTLNASSIVKDDDDESTNKSNRVFTVGESYNVYITIYGRERIEVSANLVPWTDGGDIETDIEDGDQGN